MGDRILIVEDDREIASLVEAYLAKAGFTVSRAGSCREAATVQMRTPSDLVLLDIGLPDGDGIDLLTDWRRRSSVPVIVVTARDDDVTKLSSLRIGADDYVIKPFNPSEIVERVRAVLRRTNGSYDPALLTFGRLVIDLDARIILCRNPDGSDARIAVTPTEYELLTHMARYPRKAFTRSELLAAIAPDSDALDRVIDSHVSKLRAKLGAAGIERIVEPVRGIGYRLWVGS